jgi:hypothetical protein
MQHGNAAMPPRIPTEDEARALQKLRETWEMWDDYVRMVARFLPPSRRKRESPEELWQRLQEEQRAKLEREERLRGEFRAEDASAAAAVELPTPSASDQPISSESGQPVAQPSDTAESPEGDQPVDQPPDAAEPTLSDGWELFPRRARRPGQRPPPAQVQFLQRLRSILPNEEEWEPINSPALLELVRLRTGYAADLTTVRRALGRKRDARSAEGGDDWLPGQVSGRVGRI